MLVGQMEREMCVAVLYVERHAVRTSGGEGGNELMCGVQTGLE